MSILQMSLSFQSLSSSTALSSRGPLSAHPFPLTTTKLSTLTLKTTPVRMGGGPRTYPGGVSKWQWKRMQAKKAKQLLKARLARERQIYEMRKRAELKAAVSELERPWEAVERPPVLFSVAADEQLKVLADRFQRPGGLDLWSERDGPELFRPDNGLPSARFFPKGVVHSVKPYEPEDFEGLGPVEDSGRGPVSRTAARYDSLDKGGNFNGNVEKKGSRRTHSNDSEKTNLKDAGYRNRIDGTNRDRGVVTNGDNRRSRRSREKGGNVDSEVFDMSLQNDGAYGFKLDK